MVRAPAESVGAVGASPGSESARDVGDTPRTFSIAATVGSAMALLLFTVLLRRRPPGFGGILDAQARALFHGRWNMPLRPLGIEAFAIHGRYYTYFGLWPSIVRMPVLLVTNRFDGHLTSASMVLALAVTMVSTARLHWSIREVVRPAAPLRTGEALAVGGFQLLVGAGSVIIFLGSRPLVYHELELWGIATALLTADCLCRYARAPSFGRAVAAGLAATVAAMSRPSVGFGAIAAVGLLVLAEAVRRPGSHEPPRAWSRIGVLAGTGVVLPGAVYALINEARFGTLYSLPLDRQVFTAVDHQRQLTLAANGGSLFGIKFLPTTLLQYMRPDAIRFTGHYPFVDFPLHRAHVFGNVVFDTLDRSSSITASMPGLLVLAAIGAVFVAHRRGLLAWAVAPAAIGLTAGTAFVLTIAYVTNRYLADFVPPLVVLSIAGVQGIASTRPRRARSGDLGRLGVGALVALCAFGAWASFGLAVVYQRDLRPQDPGYGRGTGASAAATAPAVTAAPATGVRLARNSPTSQAAPIAASITIDGSAVARRRVWP